MQIVKIDIYEYGCIWTPLEVFNYDIPDPQKVCFIQSGAGKNYWEVLKLNLVLGFGLAQPKQFFKKNKNHFFLEKQENIFAS